MKKVFMCVNMVSYNDALGITKKILDQKNAFEKLGYTVLYSGYLENGTGIFDTNGNVIDICMYNKFLPERVKKLLRRFYLMKHCFMYVKDNYFDIGFIRWDAVDACFLKVLRQLRLRSKIVIMDFHGYFPNYTPTSIKGKYIIRKTKANGSKMKEYVDVGLTESNNSILFGIKCQTIDTGIDVYKYNKHLYIGDAGKIEMISVSNEATYHGLDRLIRGLKAYSLSVNQPYIGLHLVGNISNETKQLIRDLKLQDIIHLYGYRSGADLESIYSKCNVGVGPLAPHRIGGKEGTGIKTKEYFAIGIPYFFAGKELLVPDNFPYVFNVTDDETPINIEEIVQWFNRIKNDRYIQDNMRQFALDNYSWEKMFSKAIKQCKTIS